MLSALMRLLARLPLRVLHRLGAWLGRLAYLLDRKYSARLRENLAGSGLAEGRPGLLRLAVEEAGKGVAELPVIWLRNADDVVALVRRCSGWEHVEAAHRAGRGLIFLTPHLGCFEVSSLYYAARHPITVLYRPPKLRWLEPLLGEGRQRGQVSLATTDLKGVRALLKALKRGEAVGMLPDQVPSRGEGVWAPFFGRPAYTVTLAARLQQSTGAAIVMAFAERLPHGRGYALWLEPLAPLPEDPEQAAVRINAAIEGLVRRCPQQYLWSYNRYKVPRGASAPGTPASDAQ